MGCLSGSKKRNPLLSEIHSEGTSRCWLVKREEARRIENLPQEGIILKVFPSFTSAGQSPVHVTWPLTTSLTLCNLGRLKVSWAIFTAKKAAGTLDKKQAWATGGGNIEMLFWCFFLCRQGDGQLAPWHDLLWLGKLLRGAAARCGFQATFTSRRECPSQELLCFYHVVAIYIIFCQVDIQTSSAIIDNAE